MNRQPYCLPPRWWEPKMSPWWVRLSRRYRLRQLRCKQRLVGFDAQNVEVLREAVAAGQGVLLTPNHSAHHDATSLYTVADSIDLPLYFMTAWQVFAMSPPFQRWAMQHMGCFSIDREGNDRQAFKQAVHILREEPYPLVIFPEGDIYHMNDCVTPFREGATAVALAAARRAPRPVVVIPCGIKFWYLDDPTPELLETLRRIEQRLYLRSPADLPLPVRIHRLAEAALALKELDYLGHTRSGRLRDRVRYLLQFVLGQLEDRHQITDRSGMPPARVKAVRQVVIRKLEGKEKLDGHQLHQLESDMEDLFLVMQLYSYRGDYLVGQPSIERMAETIDKFEEDILGMTYPTVRGRRHVVVRFGDPLKIDEAQRRRRGVAQLTQVLEQRVQALLDELNSRSPKSQGSAIIPGGCGNR